MNNVLVEIKGITKEFGPQFPPALKDISATINRGEIIGLAGPDGAGKTTLIRLIAALLLPTKGSITIENFDTVNDAAQISHLIGYMPQKFGLYEDLTVQQNLNLFADLRGLPDDQRKSTFERLLKFTGLAPFTYRISRALSGGMKQKLGLACALVSKPTLLLLDEPSVGVDPISRRELWIMIKELLEENISVVWSTSYLDEAERCDSVLLLHKGELLYHGKPEGLTKQVDDRVFLISGIETNRRILLRDLLDKENIIDGTIQGSDIRIVIHEKKEPPYDPSGLPPNLIISKIPSRFEDAFIDILGGGPGGVSALAEATPEVHKENDIVVEARHLTKKFGDFTAAEDITFEIKAGETFGLLGPNGAGKSTTFKMLCGLLKPTSGEAFVNGLNLQSAPSEARAQIGYMAQKFSMYGNLSMKQNLDFFSGIYNLSGSQRKQMINRMIEIFNFTPYLNESAEQLPLGFKQRLALSCAVMHYPKVLFLDEPTSGVDPITRREFWTHINGLVEKGVTIVVTTHFMDEAEYCDRIGLVYKSKIIRMGTPEELKNEVKSLKNPSPTLEDAFIYLIEQHEQANHG